MTKKRHQNIPASYLTLMKDNKVLLLRRFNTGYGDGKYSMVAGHIDQGETFTQCIIREAKEEAGILLKPEELEVVHVMHRNSDTAENNERVDVFFVARQWQGELQNKEPHKCGAVIGFINITIRLTLLHHGGSGLIDELIVDKAYREKGIGTLLIDAASKKCKQLGCCEVEVSTEFTNTTARRFYKNSGFEERGVILEKDL